MTSICRTGSSNSSTGTSARPEIPSSTTLSLIGWLLGVLLLSAQGACGGGKWNPPQGNPAMGQLTVYPGVAGIHRHGRGPAFFAGPGDPEDFLFRNDIDDIIGKLQRTGSRTLYVQMVRSHGGDGEPTHNPFVDHDPNKGVDAAVLDAWYEVLRRLGEIDVDVFLFFYDDGASPWGERNSINAAEEQFITTVVKRFQDLPNLVWVVAEEYSEAMSPKKVSRIARLIHERDHHRHPIGVHKLAGTSFDEFADDPHISVFLAQLPELSPLELYEAGLRMRQSSRGRYLPIMSEMAGWTGGRAATRRAWATAMTGTPVLAYTYDVASTDPRDLRVLAELQAFFEETGAHTFEPLPRSESGVGLAVLADRVHDRYLLYPLAAAAGSDPSVSVPVTRPGCFELVWLEIDSGRRITQRRWGDGIFSVPPGLSGDWALYVARQVHPRSEFPDQAWQSLSPEEAGIPADRLEHLAEDIGGDGCVVRLGRLVGCWGDITKTADWASISKPIVNSMMLIAQDRGQMGSFHDSIANVGWGLRDEDRHMTWHQLLNMTSGYGLREPPGEAWGYNDHGVRLYMLSFERVMDASVGELAKQYLAPLSLEDPPLFGSRKGLGVRTSVRDMARIALWWRNHGQWAGTALLPAERMMEFMRPAVPASLPSGRRGGGTYLDLGSFGGNVDQVRDGPGYFGNGWWFNSPMPFSDMGLAWPSLPADTIMSTGHWGQKLVAIFPSLELIVVWRSSDSWEADDYDLGIRESRLNTTLGRFLQSVAPLESPN